MAAETIINKEIIAARMFRHCVRYWEAKDADIDNLDPLVRLLIEACAVELYRVSNEINTVQQQMLEKLARLLTPEIYTAPRPAHAVVHARPVEPDVHVHPLIQFFHQKKVASKANGPIDTNLDVFFSPGGYYKAVDGDIKFIASDKNIFSINKNQHKDSFLKINGADSLEPYSIWLGIELSHQVTDLSGISFFFDLKNHPSRSELLPLLHYSRWSINDQPLEIQEGLWNPRTQTPYLESYSGFDEFDISQTVERFVNNYYKDHFITIVNASELTLARKKYPSVFAEYFTEKDLAKFQKEMLWVNVKLLPEFDEVALEDLSVSINCFPVINRYLNETRYRLQSSFNIIPLLSNEQFLAINSVESVDGGTNPDANKYTSLPFENTSELKTQGTYTLRTGDIERFDSRNATEYLNYLVELLRDESSAFAAFGQDFVASLVKELRQNITQLEQKIKQNISVLNNEPTYLLINPRKEGETIFANYWTTNGEAGNHIRSGSKLELYQGSELLPETLVLMTGSSGGRDKLNTTEVLQAYKNTLITRGRIVTLEDVKSFCRNALGEKARKIEIAKGVAVSHLPHEGLVHVVEIKITPAGNEIIDEEWDGLIRDLYRRLEEQSAITTNYKILLNKPAAKIQ